MITNSPFARDVYIVDGMRTPYLKSKSVPGPFSASDLAVQAGRELLLKHSFSPKELDEVIIGCVMPGVEEANIARVIALRLGCGKQMPAYTVQRNCASGMQALDSAAKDIACGRANLVLAGGTEAMTRAPLLFGSAMTTWFSGLMSARGVKGTLLQYSRFRPSFLRPVIALLKGLTDPLVNLSMGQTAENLAYQFDISREEMDEFSLRSHERVAKAQDERLFNEVTTIFGDNNDYYSLDDGVRRDTNLQKLGKLKPYFDKKFGNVTAGNSSQVSDGAAMVLLASKEAVEKYQLPVIARIIDVEWAGVDPAEMGLGPVHAVHKLLKRQSLEFDQIDFWEINEAFAAQVIACLRAFASDAYCQTKLGEAAALGRISLDKLNIDGGAIALGHPVGSSGARIVFHLAKILEREKGTLGVASICIGGGQGGAMLIEKV